MNNSQATMQEIEYLQNRVYPKLHTALVQLIEHVVTTKEVQKHQERLRKIKIADRIEQKRVEKERLKKELGSAYGSSSEASFDGEEGIINQSQDGIVPPPQDLLLVPDKSIDELTSQDMKKEINHSLNQIQEDQEEEEAQDKYELEKMKQLLKQQREELEFNPLMHLAQLIRQLDE